ncbi:MAG: crossover junction endodeoxyribonuclease RuvC [Elusimicrobiota bacterium]
MNAPTLGIDPGMSETGWAVLGGVAGAPSLIASGLIKTYPGSDFASRLKFIHDSLCAVVQKHALGAIAVEEMFFLKAAHTIRKTLQARGVVLLAAAQSGLPIREYNPRTVKLSLTGSGIAKKPQIQTAVKRALRLNDILRPDDVSDAAAIALCHMRSERGSSLKVLERHGGRA